MFKKLSIGLCLHALIFLCPSYAAENDLSSEDSLVFRFTGPEAQNLSKFMKERLHRETDFGETRYYGDTMSLACNDQDNCYLWLVRKEWQLDENNLSPSTVLKFTLPVKQTTLSGRLTLTAPHKESQREVNLQLQDLYFPGSFSFTKAMDCPSVRGPTDAVMRGEGDCRLELSGSSKKTLPYATSIQFMHNLDKIVLNFKGPWARKLFNSAASIETDPHDPMRLRARLGPTSYCWNLDPLEQDRYLLDAYVCQSSLLKQSSKLEFSSQGSIKDANVILSLKPAFQNEILRDLNLTLEMEGQEWTIAQCPNFSKSSGYTQCSLFYDWKLDTGLYPIGNSVQGVAVGWGVIKPKE